MPVSEDQKTPANRKTPAAASTPLSATPAGSSLTSTSFEQRIDEVQIPLGYNLPGNPHELELLWHEAQSALQSFLHDQGWHQPPQGSENPLFLVYQCEHRGHRQRGIIGLCDASEVHATVLAHEHIRSDRAGQIARWQDTMRLQWTPVFLSYRQSAPLTHCLAEYSAHTPVFQYVTIDSRRVSLWKIQDPEGLTKIRNMIRNIPHLYIADGHHRAEACRLSSPRSDMGGIRPMLSVLIADRDLRVYPFYRRIRNDQSPLPFWEILDRLRSLFKLKPCSLEQMFYQYLPARHFLLVHKEACWLLQPLTPMAKTVSPEKGTVTLATNAAEGPRSGSPPKALEQNDSQSDGHEPQSDGHEPQSDGHEKNAPETPEAAPDVLDVLDVQWLQDHVLAPICGITDPATDPRLDFGSMNISLDAFKKILNQATTEFILVPRAPSTEEVFRFADQGLILPPKSTSFEPKIPSGLVTFLHSP